MGLFALDIALWLLGVRGDIPRFDDFRPMPATPAAGPHPAHVMRVLAAIVAVLTLLSLATWVTVWLAIELL